MFPKRKPEFGNLRSRSFIPENRETKCQRMRKGIRDDGVLCPRHRRREVKERSIRTEGKPSADLWYVGTSYLQVTMNIHISVELKR